MLIEKETVDLNILDNIPKELRAHMYWCLWAYELRNGDKTKVPKNPRTGGNAQSSNGSTFSPFDTAYSQYKRGEFNGLGVGVFNGLCAVDIDHCREGEKLSEMASDIVSTLDSYAEISPSGTGIRIFFYSKQYKPDKKKYYVNNSERGLEIYLSGSTNKFLTVTGNTILHTSIRDVSQELPAIMDKYMQRKPKCKQSKSTAKEALPIEDIIFKALSDDEVIATASRASNGNLFNALWNGDISGYESHSNADLALCNLLAFYTCGNAGQMDRLFRVSGLYRDKWDNRRGGSTYGADTIRQAIDGCKTFYNSRKEARHLGENSELEKMHPESNERYPHTELGAGYLFADYHRDKARYVPERRAWFIYNGRVWEKDEQGVRTREFAKRFARALRKYAASIEDDTCAQQYIKFALRWQSFNYREIVIREAQSVYPVSFKQFDSDPYLFNCKNGTLNLQTGEFLQHTPGHYLSKMANVEYKPEARSERWERFINEIMQGDNEKARFLQKALGYALTGDASRECLFILYGATTRNGKGTTMETFLKLVGDYGRTASPDSITQRQKANGSAPSEDVARLAGSRFINISEPDKSMVLSAALIKSLTGNDTITARYLNENSFEFKMIAKIFLNTNYLPSITDTTIFDSDRVHVIPFERHFSAAERDTGLKSELCKPENLSGILNWCLDGWKALQCEGFKVPPAVTNATDSYREDSDKIGRFMADEMVQMDKGEIKLSVAYARYESWCREGGYRAENSRNFTSAIRHYASVERKRPRTGGEAVQHIIGYILFPNDENPFINSHQYS